MLIRTLQTLCFLLFRSFFKKLIKILDTLNTHAVAHNTMKKDLRSSLYLFFSNLLSENTSKQISALSRRCIEIRGIQSHRQHRKKINLRYFSFQDRVFLPQNSMGFTAQPYKARSGGRDCLVDFLCLHTAAGRRKLPLLVLVVWLALHRNQPK